jgi:DNA-binding transcriptional MerR regulator
MGWFNDATNWVSETASTVADNVSSGASAVAHAVTHPAETYDKAVSVTADAMGATADYFEERGAMGFIQDAARTVEVAGQGLVKGLGAGAGVVGDLVVHVGYNLPVLIANQVVDEPIEYANFNMAGKAAEALAWTEPENDYERAIMAGGQVIGEVGAFVAVTVATAGVGGAVIGGTAAAARTGTVAAARIGATSAARTASTATANFVNPLASGTAAVIEGGVGALRYNQLTEIENNANAIVDDINAETIDGIVGGVLNEQQDLQQTMILMREEVAEIKAKLNDPSTSDADKEALYDRADEIKEGHEIIKELRSEIPEERRQELHQRLDEIQPNDPIAQQEPEIQNDAVAAHDTGVESYESDEDISLTAMVSQTGDMNIQDQQKQHVAPALDADNKATLTVG